MPGRLGWLACTVHHLTDDVMASCGAGTYYLPVGAHSFTLSCNATDFCASTVTIADEEDVTVRTAHCRTP